MRQKIVDKLHEERDFKSLLDAMYFLKEDEEMKLRICRAILEVQDERALPGLLRIKKMYEGEIISNEFSGAVNETINFLVLLDTQFSLEKRQMVIAKFQKKGDRKLLLKSAQNISLTPNDNVTPNIFKALSEIGGPDVLPGLLIIQRGLEEQKERKEFPKETLDSLRDAINSLSKRVPLVTPQNSIGDKK